ncbi:Cytokinin dehydrogenase 5-like protein [Drosera capensis]
MKLLLAVTAICRLIVAIGLVTVTGRPTITELSEATLNLTVSVDAADLAAAARDFGGTAVSEPTAVMSPETAEDVARMVRAAHESEAGWAVSARGHGHSVNGQAQVPGKLTGVVVQMSQRGLRRRVRPRVAVEGMYVDAWGGEMWADVLRATLEYGLAPKSWTDYLYLTVGGTLSNAGISGQAFNHGPQISNVLQMDVVTGKGEMVSCSKEENSELFHGVLGGLGQFGIITRARIALERAPQRVRWIRVIYSNFTAFTEDQEHLISLHGEPASKKFDYVEGFVIVDEGLINNWRSSFFSPQNPVNISSLFGGAGRRGGGGGVLYCLEITKNYFHSSDPDTVNQEIETLMKKLRYIPGSEFTSDVSYVDFLDRVHKAELKLRSKGLWEVPHPWLNLFVPKSKIAEFDRGVFKGILGNKTSGPILIYPMNKNKWDDRMTAVTPDEDVFYLVALLRSALEGGDEIHTLEYLQDQNARVLKFCREAGIDVKHYLPHYTTQEEWMNHFGNKWGQFKWMKMRYDPRHILASGQRIFTPSLGGNLATS